MQAYFRFSPCFFPPPSWSIRSGTDTLREGGDLEFDAIVRYSLVTSRALSLRRDGRIGKVEVKVKETFCRENAEIALLRIGGSRPGCF